MNVKYCGDELASNGNNINVKEIVSNQDGIVEIKKVKNSKSEEHETRKEERGKRQERLLKRFHDYEFEINYASLDEVPKNYKEAMNSNNGQR